MAAGVARAQSTPNKVPQAPIILNVMDVAGDLVLTRPIFEKYLKEKDDLHAGRKPREEVSAGVTVKDLANAFLNHKKARLESGDLSPRTWENYRETADLIVSQFGKSRLGKLT